MAMGDPNAPDVTERKRKMALPKRSPRRKVNTTAMPTVLPKPMALRKGPLQQQAPDMDAMSSQGATVTPASGVMSDRAMAIPTAADAANMERARARQMAAAKAKEPREYATFSEFLKTMGLGK